MRNQLAIIGAPSSAGAYAPGQEKAPAALRAAGLLDDLRAHGVQVEDAGDVPGFRWRIDRLHPRAMNAEKVASVAVAVADRVHEAMGSDSAVLVLGGDCTVELGTVAGALKGAEKLGLVYIDLDTDLNTPESTDEGALDWMGVAHMLGLDGTVPELVRSCPVSPMLQDDQLLYFANDNSLPFERRVIEERKIAEVRLAQVQADPAGEARAVIDGWVNRFDRLLVHLDVDVLDFFDIPLAEVGRRNRGLRFEQLIAALEVFFGSPNWAALTVAELNPDHGEADGSTLRTFSEKLSEALGRSPRFGLSDKATN